MEKDLTRIGFVIDKNLGDAVKYVCNHIEYTNISNYVRALIVKDLKERATADDTIKDILKPKKD